MRIQIKHLSFLALFSWLTFSCSTSFASFPPGVVDEKIVDIVYRGGEKLVYEVSWSGGVKIGELSIEVNRLEGSPDRYELLAKVQDSGLFHFFYPVDDTFITVVEGDQRLPVSYRVHQKEGRSYEARRRTDYDQDSGQVRYQKNELDPQEYQVEGAVHNEFSSFFFTRIMHLDQKQPVVVPTFADGKRHEVEVRTGPKKMLYDTIRGDVIAIPVIPIMKFKGLYDKEGDTVTWFTGDSCRIPILITSEILIGSLVAELISYTNPSCLEIPAQHKKIPGKGQRKDDLELGE